MPYEKLYDCDDDCGGGFHVNPCEVEWGDCFLYWTEASEGPVAVFGQVPESIDDYLAETTLGPAEIEHDRVVFADLYERDYRAAVEYSVLDPHGEHHTIHLGHVRQKLSPRLFALAREYGWDVEALVRDGLAELVPFDDDYEGTELTEMMLVPTARALGPDAACAS